METLVEIIGAILIEVLQEVWPPILAILNGALVLLFVFLTWLYYTEGEPVKAVISLLVGILFLVVFVVIFKAGGYRRHTTKKRRNSRRK